MKGRSAPFANLPSDGNLSVSMRSRAFTLIEICLAVLIISILISVAIPSIKGLLDQQKSKESFDRFDALAHRAQSLAMSERRAYVLVWDKTGILLRPSQSASKEEANGIDRIDLAKEEACQIDFPAALVKKPSPQWVFWPSGTCESAKVTYQGSKGTWLAEYDPLTVRATFSSNEKE